MSKNISRQVSDISEVSLAFTDSSATATAASSGSAVFGGMYIGKRGKPNTILQVNADNYLNVIGTPFHMREGAFAESARQLKDAVVGGNGYVVRVMPSDARYPVITVDKTPVSSKNPVSKKQLAYGSKVTADDANDVVSFYLVDGDNELQRSITLVAANTAEYGSDMFILTLFELDKQGAKQTLETHVVSFKTDAYFNGSAFIEDVLARDSQRLNCLVTLPNVASFVAMDEATFTGGTSGTPSTIGTSEYALAALALKQAPVSFNFVLALGCYDDTTLHSLKDIAVGRNIPLYYDLEPNISYGAALARNVSLAIASSFACALHLPYSAKDPFYEGRSMWGLSGAAFAAKSRGLAKSQPTGGYHFSIAGEERGVIQRGGLELNDNAGLPDYAEMVKKRINKVAIGSTGVLHIDDSLTTHPKHDQLRFEWIASVDMAIGRDMVSVFNTVKHQPDGVTAKELKRQASAVLDRYVTSGALTEPRNPEDGTEPYVLTIKQVEADLWSITWDISVTGSARRLVGQSRLFR